MRALTTHLQLAAELQHAHGRVRETIAGLTDEEASVPAADGWSIKDQLTHLTLWHEFRFFEISRVARGGSACFPDSSEAEVTLMNETFAAFRRVLSLEQVIADLEFAWAMVDQAVAASPEDRLDSRLYQEIGIQGGAAHDILHADAIVALRQRSG